MKDSTEIGLAFVRGLMIACVFIAVATAIWWLPQKWQACQKLYDNRPAQIICVMSNS